MGERHEKEPITGVDESVTPAKPVVELPGQRLRDQREASQLSREEVAHHLRLDTHTIQALEEDNYSRLPSPAYICGYLRSYAKLLKLPEDEIVQAYNHGELIISDLTPAITDILPLKKVNKANSGLLKSIILVAVALIVAVGLYWIAGRFGLFSGSSAKEQTSIAMTNKPLAVPPAPDDNTNKSDQAEPFKSAQLAKSKLQVANKKGNSTEPVKKPANSVPSSKPEPLVGKTLIEKLPVPRNTIPGSEPAKLAVKTSPTNVAERSSAKPITDSTVAANDSAQTTQLHMHFNDDSWAEVTDSTGNRLVYHLIEKNTDLDLDGVPPFTVLLGNAAAVQVFYQGKEFDHSQYRHNQVANFKVGG